MSKDSNLIEVDYLGNPPNWMTRKGSVVLLVVFLLVMITTLFIPYNDYTNCEVVITSTNPLVNIKSRKTGRLSQIFVENGTLVEKGQVLGQISKNAYFDDVISAKKIASEPVDWAAKDSIKTKYRFPLLTLGPIQAPYSAFQKEYKGLESFMRLRRNETDLNVLSNKIVDKNGVQNYLYRSIKSAREDLKISERNYERSKTLFDKGVYSKMDLDRDNVELLERRKIYNTLNQQSAQVSLELNEMSGGLTNIDLDQSEKMDQLMTGFESTRQDLLNAIHDWEELNVLTSPIKGRVATMGFWSENQEVENGEILFSINPVNKGSLIGIAKVPIRNSGKVKSNQKAIIKLHDFPYGEWGALQGEVASISESPKKEEELVYIAYIKIDSSVTTFKKDLLLRGEMYGTTEIILEKTNLFQRLFFNFRDVFIR